MEAKNHGSGEVPQARRLKELLMTYGWADSILQPMVGVNYYEGFGGEKTALTRT